MKKINNNFYSLLAVITTFIAVSVATSACTWYLYQPEEPESLKNM